MYKEAAKDREAREKKQRGPSPPPPAAPPSIYNEQGKIRQCNEGKYRFFIDEFSNPAAIIFKLQTPRFLCTSLIDVDVQPTFIRCSIKGKVTQLKLPDEVATGTATVRRSKSTGELVVTMYRLRRPTYRFCKTRADPMSSATCDNEPETSYRHSTSVSLSSSQSLERADCGPLSSSSSPSSSSCSSFSSLPRLLGTKCIETRQGARGLTAASQVQEGSEGVGPTPRGSAAGPKGRIHERHQTKAEKEIKEKQERAAGHDDEEEDDEGPPPLEDFSRHNCGPRPSARNRDQDIQILC
eukprot:GHVT01072652.1.p1 GENE.GHVT01072652.1~~GHVT01072652.1.p1  ORF type:complete len:296 (+),score=62.31 GHVT01072652.1:1848-2735(+)